MSFGQVGGYIVDTCVLLPQPLESVIKSCSNFLKSNQANCFLTSSIAKEACTLIEQSHDAIIEHFHKDLRPFLEKACIKEISNRDGKLIADFFAEQKMVFKIKAHVRSNIPNEFISSIENYLCDRIHSLQNGQKIPIDVFLASATTQLAIAKHNLEAPFKALKCLEIVPADAVKNAVADGAMIKNSDDVAHLASAVQYQFGNNKWVIFVTTDQNEILSRQKELLEMFLRCSSPQWASDYYVDLTRNKAPKYWVREIRNPSTNQKRILDAIRV